MTRLYEHAYLGNRLVPIGEANVSVASSAVLYGLSVYTVFHVVKLPVGYGAFRLPQHFERLLRSAKIMGIDTFEQEWTQERFRAAVQEVVQANAPQEDVFVRASVHVSELIPGTRSRGLATTLSLFVYEAKPILPSAGARLKSSPWRRIPDTSIPSRAKVNGAYVNSVLARQDAIDSGYDDCIFLDAEGHVCELSAANIFMVRDGALITPGVSADLLEGITRRTVLETARELGIPAVERPVDLTELYIADEAFACGTSAYVTPVLEVDARKIGKEAGPLTKRIQERLTEALHGKIGDYLTAL